VQEADEEAVLLLRVVLALVGAVLDLELEEGRLVAGHLGVQRLLDTDAALNFGLALLDLRQDAVDVLQLIAPLPEHLAIVAHLLLSLSFDLLRNAVDVFASILLVRLDELLEVALAPAVEAHRQQALLLLLLLVGQLLGLVNLFLLFDLLLLGLFGV